VAEDIDSDYPQLSELIQNMWDTLERSEGIGLAAPQVGLSIRLIVIDLNPLSEDMPQYKDFKRVYINPYIEDYDETETDVSEEGCLSLPGIHEKVRRPTRIRLSWQDEQFQEHEEWIDGYLARVIQHEVDHLEGEVFTDHLKGLRRQMVKTGLNNILKGKFSCSYKVKLRK
jgi:peptide deformylase